MKFVIPSLYGWSDVQQPMQVDEEKKVEAVKDFYNNLGSFSIVDKLQIVSKYRILGSKKLCIVT